MKQPDPIKAPGLLRREGLRGGGRRQSGRGPRAAGGGVVFLRAAYPVAPRRRPVALAAPRTGLGPMPAENVIRPAHSAVAALVADHVLLEYATLPDRC